MKIGYFIDVYVFGMFVSDILDIRVDLGKLICYKLLKLVLYGNIICKFEVLSF